MGLIFKATLLLLGFGLIKPRTWVGEDAFIFFRYVDNFINGHGLVFNIGERVEGFTAPLWVFLLSVIRLVTGAELRPTAIILGFILSMAALAYLLIKDNSDKYVFPLGFLLIISNSAFRDFATSGFETSLTYLLLIVFAVYFKKHFLEGNAFLVGLVLSLLILNRPESFLLFAYVAVLYLFKKRAQFGKYLSAFLLTVVPYQIFRMGYYASLLPNTFYAKKGGELYFSQGLKYVSDFFSSYPITSVILCALTLLLIVNLFRKRIPDEYSHARLHLLIMSALLLAYVLYAGGDYMHGRSLLMFFILWVVTVNDLAEKLFHQFIEGIMGTDLEKPLMYIGTLGALFVLFFILKSQTPFTVQQKKQINFINDERTHFGITFEPDQFKYYISIPITGEFNWRDRGFYYRDISEMTEESISVNMPNIGFFGYAAGDNVSVKGAVLIDPVMARDTLEQRGKIGHENLISMPYVLSQRPTFSYTPFRYWNDNAHAKYNNSQYSGVITDDSNDSYIPVFDMSNSEFLKKYSRITGVDVKSNVDMAQLRFLNEVTKNNMGGYNMDVKEYFSFLKMHWYPYTSESSQGVYTKKRQEIFGNTEVLGSYEKFEKESQSVNERWEHVTGDMNINKFVDNFFYALK